MGRISYSGNLLTTFIPGTGMVATEMNDIFLDVANEDAIYNVINELDDDPIRGSNFADVNDLWEWLFQFYPVRVKGTNTTTSGAFVRRAHTHEDTTDTGRALANGAVHTEQVDRPDASLVYTGIPKVVMISGLVDWGVAPGKAEILGNLTQHTPLQLTWTNLGPAPLAGQRPAIILSIESEGVANPTGDCWVEFTGDPTTSPELFSLWVDTTSPLDVQGHVIAIYRY